MKEWRMAQIAKSPSDVWFKSEFKYYFYSPLYDSLNILAPNAVLTALRSALMIRER